MTTLATTGVALGGSLLTPSAALAAPAPAHVYPAAGHDPDDPHHDLDRDDDARTPRHRAAGDHDTDAVVHRGARQRSAEGRHTRPMTSGERQYRNNCRRGLIADHCESFDASHLLRRGINPYL